MDKEPNISSRVMGGQFGLTAVEMNMLLKEQGFLDGEPGAYGPSEMGKLYVHEDYVQKSHLTGYDKTTWDPSIKKKLDLSEERLQQAREAASARRAVVRAARAAETVNERSDTGETNGSDVDLRRVAVVLGVTVLVVIGIYGIKKAAPKLKAHWIDKITPRLEERKNRNAGGANTDAEIPDSDERPSA